MGPEDEGMLTLALQRVLKHLRETSDWSQPVVLHRPPNELADELELDLGDARGAAGVERCLEDYLKYCVRTHSPRFMNQLFSGVTATSLLAELVTAATNTSMYTYEVAPVATLIERTVLDKVRGLVGFTDGDGVFVTGGSNANLVAMLAARDRIRPESHRAGISNGAPLIAFTSASSHYSYETAAFISGIGVDQLVRVDTDAAGRMKPEALRAAIEQAQADGGVPFFVGATAGTTVQGTFDPLAPLADICQQSGVWLHVDGAWGGAVALSPVHEHRLAGIERADSFSWDAHKLLGMPLICSMIVLRERGVLRRLNQRGGMDYLFHDDGSFDLGRSSLQCGRRVDALKLFLTWVQLGDSGLAERVDELIAQADYARERVLASSALESVGGGDYLNVCFRVRPSDSEGVPAETDDDGVDEWTVAVREELVRSGRLLVNRAVIAGRPCIRLVMANAETDRTHVDTFFEQLNTAARELQQ